MNSSPPIPDARGSRFFRALAQYCWASVLFSIALSIGLDYAAKRAGAASVRPLLIYGTGSVVLTGILAGIIALFGVRRHGRKGILWPAVVGLSVWAALTALAVPGILRVRREYLARQATPSGPPAATPTATAARLKPVVRIPGAAPLRDAELRLALDVPARFEAFDARQQDPKMKHAFLRPGDDGKPRVLVVTALGGTLPRKRMQPENVPKGQPGSLLSFNWRGVEVDAFRVPEKFGGLDYLTFNVQLPLRPQAIQLGLGGPAEAEGEIRAMVLQVLASLEGESTW